MPTAETYTNMAQFPGFREGDQKAIWWQVDSTGSLPSQKWQQGFSEYKFTYVTSVSAKSIVHKFNLIFHSPLLLNEEVIL